MRYIARFARFWYDFLIGDRPELFVGPLVGLVVVGALVGAGLGSVATPVLVAVVIGSGAWSVFRGVARSTRSD